MLTMGMGYGTIATEKRWEMSPSDLRVGSAKPRCAAAGAGRPPPRPGKWEMLNLWSGQGSVGRAKWCAPPVGSS